ncbi:MAG: MotA/TolQ/ExbB proton channel family protein [Fibrobacteres bacterium]|nr:MotA/TolQ/ExbB proton channel family protein [Fibrobacterota bacterium]
MSFLDQLILSFAPSQAGYGFMWILVLLALLAIYYVIKRGIFLSASSNINANHFTARILNDLREGKPERALDLCNSAGKRALPWVFKGAIEMAAQDEHHVRGIVEERTISIIPRLEKDLTYIAMFANVATLLGLMGTIYGLILSFAAVGAPGVEPSVKSSMLAQGISAAMNTTLLGLIVAIPCILAYTYFRNLVDRIVADIDVSTVPLIKTLVPEERLGKDYKASEKKTKEAVETEPNMVPIMGLMVVLIPLLLSSAEFVKIGRATVNLPQSAAGGEGGGDENAVPPKTLDLGLVITTKGFTLVHSLKPGEVVAGPDAVPDIPVLAPGKYDFAKLTEKLKELKVDALRAALGRSGGDFESLSNSYADLIAQSEDNVKDYKDVYNVKLLAENKISYQIIIGVMDAARNVKTDQGVKIPLFPVVAMGVMR